MGLPKLKFAFLIFGMIFPLGRISNVPVMPSGTTWIFDHRARRAIPVLPFWILPVRLLVPSGYITISFSFLMYANAVLIASLPLLLSIGIVGTYFFHRLCQSFCDPAKCSFFAMKYNFLFR